SRMGPAKSTSTSTASSATSSASSRSGPRFGSPKRKETRGRKRAWSRWWGRCRRTRSNGPLTSDRTSDRSATVAIVERTPAEPRDRVATRCLEVVPGERVVILAYGAEVACPILARAFEKAGAIVTRVALGSFEDPGTAVIVDSTVRKAVAGTQVSIY